MITILITDPKTDKQKLYFVTPRIAKAIDLLLVRDDKVSWSLINKGRDIDNGKRK